MIFTNCFRLKFTMVFENFTVNLKSRFLIGKVIDSDFEFYIPITSAFKTFDPIKDLFKVINIKVIIKVKSLIFTTLSLLVSRKHYSV